MKKRKVKIDRKCQDCEVDCQCGCQSNIYSLPFEVMERVLWYQDPLTLISLERTSKFFFAIVSDFWVLYCKRNRLLKRPTPLCSTWRSKNGDGYCYEKALQQVNDDTQRWRMMAIRVYLRHNSQCVVCMSICNEKEQHFLYREDVLLCHRCLPYFSITITHDLVWIFILCFLPVTTCSDIVHTMKCGNFIKLKVITSNHIDIIPAFVIVFHMGGREGGTCSMS